MCIFDFKCPVEAKLPGILACMGLLIAFNPVHAETVAVPTQRPEAELPNLEVQAPKPAKPDLPRIYRAYCPILGMEGVSAEMVAPIDGGDCGEKSPIHLKSVHGIKLTSRTVMNCRMSMGFSEWLVRAAELSTQLLDETLSQVNTGPGYDCRRRNRKPDGKISEHGFANAVDVTGFKTESGRAITLREHFIPASTDADTDEKPDETALEEPKPTVEHLFLKAAHKEACSRFSTALGPDSGASHRDHFHLDMGCHGRDCRYKICE